MEYKQSVLNCIKKSYTADLICSELNIDLKELYNILKRIRTENNIYYFSKFLDDTNTIFTHSKNNSDDDVVIKTSGNEFEFIVISDLHIGNIYDDVERIKYVEEFINKNNIRLLLNAGDLVDGPVHFGQSIPKRIETLEEQIELLCEVYPYINGINVCVLGGHDTDYKTTDGKSLNKILRSSREDLKIYSSGAGNIKINGKTFLLCHDANDTRIKQRMTDDQILISGHSHMYINNTIYTNHGYTLKIVCPSLSNLPLYNDRMPGFLKFNLTYNGKNLTKVVLENYSFYDNRICFNNATVYNSFTRNDIVRKKIK